MIRPETRLQRMRRIERRWNIGWSIFYGYLCAHVYLFGILYALSQLTHTRMIADQNFFHWFPYTFAACTVLNVICGPVMYRFIWEDSQ